MAALLQKRAEMTRKKILEAAINDFSSTGPSATTVEQIAGSAGVNKQRIYAYFGSKKKLFEAVLLEVFSESAESFKEFAAAIKPGESNITFELSQYYQELHLQKPEFRRLLAWANLESTIDPAALSAARQQENECLRNWFNTEQSAGRIRSEVAFESWLLTVMGTAYFASANAKTLRNTLGESFLSSDASQQRSSDLAKIFSNVNN